MLFVEETSKKNKELVDVLRERENAARSEGNLKEAQFLLRVKHMVLKGVAMEHDASTLHICPRCQAPMETEHGIYCSQCGQLVK